MNSPSDEEVMRLLAISDHLGVKRNWDEAGFEDEVIQASLRRVEPIVRKTRPRTGDGVASSLAAHFRVFFEEVYAFNDVERLEQKYLREKGEIGFAQLRDEISNSAVDALLFQRIHAAPEDPDQWVAVLNLQNSASRGYWD